MKIAIAHLENIFKVMGTTEPYYVTKYLSLNNRLFLFIPRDDDRTVEDRNGYIIDYLSSEKAKLRWRTVVYNLLLLPFVYCHLKNRFDIIYTYNRIVLPGVMLKYLFGVKWVCDFRVSPFGQEREVKKILGKSYVATRMFYRFIDFLNKLFLKKADMVIVISEEIGKELVDIYKVNRKKMYTLPLGVDLERFCMKEVGSFNNEHDISRIIYLGVITSYRGLDVIFRALAEALKKDKNIILKLVGKGDEEDVDSLKQLAETLGIANHIQWVGEVPHHQVVSEIDASLIAVSPLPDVEFFRVSSPTKVFEYLALNKIVLASDILAHRKIIEHGKNGLLIEPDNVHKWADAIIEVIRNKGLRHSLASEARKSIEAHDWKIMVKRLEERLNDLIVYRKDACLRASHRQAKLTK